MPSFLDRMGRESVWLELPRSERLKRALLQQASLTLALIVAAIAINDILMWILAAVFWIGFAVFNIGLVVRPARAGFWFVTFTLSVCLIGIVVVLVALYLAD